MQIKFLKNIYLIFFKGLFLLAFLNPCYSEYINLYEWDYLKLSVNDIIPYTDSEIIVLKKNKKAAIINLSTFSQKSIAGRFLKIVYGPNENIWGLHTNKSLYYFADPIWKRIDINEKIKDFSISNKGIHLIKDGKIKSFNKKGDEIKFLSLEKLTNIKQILFLNDQKVLLLKKNGNLKFYNNKTNLFKKNKKKIISSGFLNKYKKVEKKYTSSFNPNENRYANKKYTNPNQVKTASKELKIIPKEVKIDYDFLKGLNLKKISSNVSKILFANNEHAYVILKNKTIIFYDFTQKKIKSFKNKNSIKIKALIQNSYGNLIAIDNKKLYLSKFFVEEINTKENKAKLKQKKLSFKKINIDASKLFYGSDGTFIINKLGLLQFYINNKELLTIPGRLKFVANPGNGEIWGINHLGRIFYYKNKKWSQIKGLAKSISAKGTKVLIVDHNDLVKEFNWKNKSFKNFGRKANSIYVQNNKKYWFLRDGFAYECINKICKRKNGKFKKLSISPEGIVFALNNNNILERYNGSIFKRLNVNVKNIVDFVAIKDADIILINEDYNLLTSQKEKVNKLSKKISNYFSSNKSYDNPTIGKGVSLLKGEIANSIKMSRSVAHTSKGFKYKKNFSNQEIPNVSFYNDLSMGRDNRLWAVTQYRVKQYHEVNKLFQVYSSSYFNGSNQKYLGLPVSITVSRIISDKHERIWAIQEYSKIIHYQEKKSGLFKSITIASAYNNITDITVDEHDNVYVAAGEIFKWNYKKKKFEKITSNNNYKKISSGIAGSLWAINNDRNIYEYSNGKMNKVDGKIQAQDIDVSISGIVYATTRSHATSTDINASQMAYTDTQNVKCELYYYHPFKRKFEKVWSSGSEYAQFVAIAEDGSPWTSRSSCLDNKVSKPK